MSVRFALSVTFSILGLSLLLPPGQMMAQTDFQDPFQNPFHGSEITQPLSSTARPVSIRDAIQMGRQHNLAVIRARTREKLAGAQALTTLQPLLPKVTADASRGAHQFNLAAQGFTPSFVRELEPLFPHLAVSGAPLVVKADVVQAEVSLSQTLFDLPAIERHKAANAEKQSARHATESTEGLVVLHVGSDYLEALAAEARLNDARALLKTDQTVLDQAVEKHKAGVVPRLDELRARVQYRAQQQRTIEARNSAEKATILLKREIGLAAGQPILLTDTTPYASLATMSITEATRVAYTNRQDYQELEERIRAARFRREAARWERLPTLDFHGNYGVTGLAHGLYHGTFSAMATLRIPIFNEAQFRGDREEAESNLALLNAELDSLKQQIGQQLRDSMLDVASTAELVVVAQSSTDLARQELDQAQQRFAAGVSDTLPVTEAQSTLAAAEANLVNTTVEYNQAKLGLARNLGLIAGDYQHYLGSSR